MSKDDICLDGPFEVDVKVHITNGKQNGVVTVGLAKGTRPTAEAVKNAVLQAASAAQQQGYRLMNRHEFITELLDVGARVAIPGPETFPNAA